MPAANQQGNSLPVIPLFIGAMTSFGSLLVIGLFVLRRRLLTLTQTQPRIKLPPSGARPWSRIRAASLHGSTTLPDIPVGQRDDPFPHEM